jgi:hypothetical protein
MIGDLGPHLGYHHDLPPDHPSLGAPQARRSGRSVHRDRPLMPMTGRRKRAYARSVMLPTAPDLGLLLVRTDYSDDQAWHAALAAATAVYDRDDLGSTGALLRPVESPALSNLTAEELAGLAREDYLSQIAVADAQTMRDQTVLFVDFSELNEQVGRTFRSIPSEVEPIVANLSLANMDFAEFAGNTDPDGIFRGF